MRLQQLLWSVGINLLLVTLFFLFTNPMYLIREDVFVLYRLSGGFGSEPTELLHYNYGMHPYFAFLMKALFKINNAFNWYTFALLLGNFVALSTLLYTLLCRKKLISTLVCYLILFTVFVCQLLLHLNFSHTAIVLGMAGIVMTIVPAEPENFYSKSTLVGVVLIVLASLFRIHVLLPLFMIALPFVLYSGSKQLIKRIMLAWMLAGGMILLFNLLHQSYYAGNISGWKQDEQYRQQVYKFYNHQNLTVPQPADKWFTEFHLIRDGLPIDTNFLSGAKLNRMYAELKTNPKPGVISSENLRWLFINNKVFLVSLLLLLLFCGSKRLAGYSLVSICIFVAGYLGLAYLYAKIPSYYVVTGLLLTGFCIVLFRKEKPPVIPWLSFGPAVLSLFVIFWGIVRLHKENQKNLMAISTFKDSYASIRHHNTKLFIVSKDAFPLQFFSVFDVPKNYPLPNFLISEHFLHRLHLPVFKKFGIQESKDVPFHSGVYFWGKRSFALENYFLETNGKSFRYTQYNNDSPMFYRFVPEASK